MSTRGSFVLRKHGVDKELYIPSDTYPDWAGRRIVNLIKTTNLNTLYDLLYPGEDGSEFSADACEDAVGNMSPYEYRQMGNPFIADSIMCEYAYAIDLDRKKLEYYRHKPRYIIYDVYIDHMNKGFRFREDGNTGITVCSRSSLKAMSLCGSAAQRDRHPCPGGVYAHPQSYFFSGRGEYLPHLAFRYSLFTVPQSVNSQLIIFMLNRVNLYCNLYNPVT